MATESAFMARLCHTMTEDPLGVDMVHLVVRYFCDRRLKVQSLHNKTALATPSLPKSPHPGGSART
jgi:hypothetical protein